MKILFRGIPELRFVILLPHRDTGKILRDYRRRLFASGFPGAFSFPAAAPLALVSRPFTAEELRDLARGLRRSGTEAGRDGTFTAGPPGALPFPREASAFAGLSLFGPTLDPPPPDAAAFPACRSPFPALILCASLVPGGEGDLLREKAPPPRPGALSFRAAAVANLVIRPLEAPGPEPAYSFEWKTGRPYWLPSIPGSNGRVTGT
ncbi:MAG: hypothetical protein LBU28_02055 [Spirochaetaceae bacterium]|jgi:hypothetical protein|nr:hypothetical protein [Spirochaetaceae bacterium]